MARHKVPAKWCSRGSQDIILNSSDPTEDPRRGLISLAFRTNKQSGHLIMHTSREGKLPYSQHGTLLWSSAL